MRQTGKVYLVGAGPGDIGLITVKGLEAIKKADVILYDRLANPKLLDFAKDDCEFIYCGKLPHRHILRQEAINDLLVEKGLEGKVVTRLKGGDPSVFGRVGEEAEALQEHGIAFEIVPGITSGIAAPLYAGIPVTHREYGTSFAVVTAHDKSESGEPSIDWEGLTRGIDTIAFYMGVGNLSFICQQMMKYGKPATTPVILIQWGTFGRQKTLEGTLETIAEKVKAANFTNPAITLVGDIIKVREKVKWFEQQPLFGQQILLARTSTDESEIAKELRSQGADVIEFPKWKERHAAIDEAIINKLTVYEQMMFTSPAAVEGFFQILASREIDIRKIKADVYTFTTKSMKVLRAKGIISKLVNEMPTQTNLLIIGDNTIKEQKKMLTEKYGHHDTFITVEKMIDESFNLIIERMLEEATIDTFIFPSSASVQPVINYKSLAVHKALSNSRIIAMGKETEKAAIENGLQVSTLDKSTVDELISVLSTNLKVRNELQII